MNPKQPPSKMHELMQMTTFAAISFCQSSERLTIRIARQMEENPHISLMQFLSQPEMVLMMSEHTHHHQAYVDAAEAMIANRHLADELQDFKDMVFGKC